jgi:uncharacterized membrane protein
MLPFKHLDKLGDYFVNLLEIVSKKNRVRTMMPELLVGLQAILTIILFLALLYVVGGMADNIRKIRIMLENELRKKEEKR